jgi:hypothetical protein
VKAFHFLVHPLMEADQVSENRNVLLSFHLVTLTK